MSRVRPLSTLSAPVKLCGVLAAVLITLTACEPKVALRGNEPLVSRMEQIEVGRSTKNDVASLIGTPSTVGTFDNDTWYYMSQRKESWAFYSPEVTEASVIALNFDETGVLQNITKIDESQFTEVSYREQETPTAGRTMSILEQLFGNFGRFGG